MSIKIASSKDVVNNIDYIKNNDINLISIRDTNPSNEQIRDYNVIDSAGLKNILVADFDDLIEPLPQTYRTTYGERPPDESDIRRIINWAKIKIDEGKTDFIVHCTAGISRSSAVAILIQYLQDPSKALKVINPMLHCPNEKVLELGEKILDTKDIKDPTKNLLNEYDSQFMGNIEKRHSKN